MLTDALGTFSNQQAITATAASTDVIDFGAGGTPTPGHTVALTRDLGKGQAIMIRVQVTETFATLTSLTVSVQTDDNSGFSSATTVIATQAIPVASLVAGYVFNITEVPLLTTERYVRLNYTVAGSNATAGKIFASVVESHQLSFP